MIFIDNKICFQAILIIGANIQEGYILIIEFFFTMIGDLKFAYNIH